MFHIRYKIWNQWASPYCGYVHFYPWATQHPPPLPLDTNCVRKQVPLASPYYSLHALICEILQTLNGKKIECMNNRICFDQIIATPLTSVTRTSTAYNKFDPGHIPSWIMERKRLYKRVWPPGIQKLHCINNTRTNLCDIWKEGNNISNMQWSSFAVDP